MLLLHQFQEPHALVGTRRNGAEEHRKCDKSLFHIAIILFEIAFKVQSWQEKLNYLRRKEQITAKSQKKPQKSEGRAVRRVPRAIYIIVLYILYCVVRTGLEIAGFAHIVPHAAGKARLFLIGVPFCVVVNRVARAARVCAQRKAEHIAFGI